MAEDWTQASLDHLKEPDPVTEAQSRAAHAYANALLEPEAANAAVRDALDAYRQTLARQPAGAADSDAVLLALTRLMTAVSLPDRSSPADRRMAVLASMDAQSHCTCREAGVLLASRANQNIEPRESQALDQHLKTCADCRMLAADVSVAEHAFQNEMAPAQGSGFGISGATARMFGAGGALAVAAIVAIAAFAGSGHPATPTGTLANANTPAPAPVTTAKVAPVVHHHVVVHRRAKVVHHAVTHTATVPATPTTATTPAVPTETTAVVSHATSAATQHTAATAPVTHVTAPTKVATPPATASSAGSSSLGAVSATQQGIGTISSGG